MIPILLGSIVGLAIVLERWWFFHKISRFNIRAFSERVFYYLKTGDFNSALTFCDENMIRHGRFLFFWRWQIKYPLPFIFKTGLERQALSPQEIEKAMEGEGNNQALEMERYLGALATIVGIEPLMGFLGTITGLIKAFMSWEHAGANITVSALAAGIYEAMITTAAGLIVAIPLYIVYNYFIARIKLITQEWTDYSLRLVEVIGELKRSGASQG